MRFGALRSQCEVRISWRFEPCGSTAAEVTESLSLRYPQLSGTRPDTINKATFLYPAVSTVACSGDMTESGSLITVD